MASSMDLAYSSTTFEMQQDHQFTEKAMFYENWYPAQAVHPFQASDHVAPSSWPSHWSSYPSQHMHSSSYDRDDLSPSPSPQGASFNCNRSNNVSKPSLLSWPIECFVTNNPMHANNDSELVQSTFAPIPPHTPELLYTSSSTDESANVFDIQFGQSLQGSSYLGDNRFSSDSPPSSCSPSPLPKRRSMPISTEAIKHLQQDTRTPSPSLESNSPSPADYRRRFPCLLPGCERRFTSRYTLKVHMEAHKPKPEGFLPLHSGLLRAILSAARSPSSRSRKARKNMRVPLRRVWSLLLDQKDVG
ncbi:hypothetical protein VNI00_015314 [Paramarasmius palmivorus]|uniref:C2H2-type domain-containing protein n=1 Tax=Paramarasmius palmivorus TaxID=297713 RepID=A0AAW0BMV4_9AGAR